MRRALGALTVLLLAATLGIALPAGSGASLFGKAAKQRCKQRHRQHHKRCRGSGDGTGTGTTTGGGAGGSSGPPARLLATERELSATQLQLQLSRATLPAGAAIVEQYNAGSDPHNLVLERKGFVVFSYPALGPGGDQRQTLNLSRGTWTLYCSLLNHRALGMQATLTVN